MEHPAGLTAPEKEMLEAFRMGNVPYGAAGWTEDLHPGEGENWPDSRVVRAEVLRSALVGLDSISVHPRGVQLLGIRVNGWLDLQHVTISRPVAFFGCSFSDRISCTGASLVSLTLSRSHIPGIEGDQLNVTGDIRLNQGFTSQSAVRLTNARIGGSLDCDEGILWSGPSDSTALAAEGLIVEGDIELTSIAARGLVDLGGARIGGRLDCSDATFDSVDSQNALSLAQVIVTSDILLKRIHVKGEVGVAGARIEGQVSCGGANLSNPSGDALTADEMRVSGSVFLNDAFEATGCVRLLGVRVLGQIDCSGASLSASTTDPDALNADQATVGGGVFLDRGFRARGRVALLGVTIGGQLNCGGACFSNPESNALGLEGASISGDVFLNDGLHVEGQLRLVGLKVGGSLTCSRAKIERSGHLPAIDATDVVLGRGCSLFHADVTGNISFTNAKMSGLVDLRGLKYRSAADGQHLLPRSLEGVTFPENTRVWSDEQLDLSSTVIRGIVSLVPAGKRLSVVSMNGSTLEASVVVPDGVSLRNCQLRNVVGLSNLQILAADPEWVVWRHRRVISDEAWVRELPNRNDRRAAAKGVESTYRQLRAALEAAKAAPAAADFYYGEMEMRLIANADSPAESLVLNAYKVLSGYGLRMWRALISYALVVFGVAALVRYETSVFVSDRAAAAGVAAGSHGLSFGSYWDVVALVARSSVSFLATVTSGLTAAGTALFLLVRFAAPTFLTLAVLAARSRVQR